jgi:hypothetical protein
VTSIAVPETIFLELDVHKDSISVGILEPGREIPVVDGSSTTSHRCAASSPALRIQDGYRVCYEAGPSGYELARLLGIDRQGLRGSRTLADPPPARPMGQDRPPRRPPASRPRAVTMAALHWVRIHVLTDTAVKLIFGAGAGVSQRLVVLVGSDPSGRSPTQLNFCDCRLACSQASTCAANWCFCADISIKPGQRL